MRSAVYVKGCSRHLHGQPAAPGVEENAVPVGTTFQDPPAALLVKNVAHP
jgi:hypothetical protein